MLFTSLEFFVFLLLTLAVFALVPAQRRWLVLLLASWVFYGAARPANLLFLGAVTAVVLACRRWVAGGSRRALVLGLVAVLGSLVAFKFYDFAAGEIERLAEGLTLPRLGLAAPAGFSFYAFSAVALLIDTHARRVAAGPGASALYLAFFPKILAGPIERATSFVPRLAAGLQSEPSLFVLGLQLMLWGLVKKVVIADNLAPVVDKAFGIAAYASPIELLISIYFFAFQIYCDFSGYTDIAIGVAMLFGVPLAENFRRPYLARSTAEFWSQRWHISLGRWFRDYLYIPLGGSRAGAWRQYLNLMLVFIASGLWHAGLGYGVGWTFLVWGALNGAYQWAGLASQPAWASLAGRWPRVARSAWWQLLRVLLTFHLITLAWVFFRAKSLEEAWTILKRVGERLGEIPALLAHYPFSSDHLLGACLILGLIAVELLDERRSIFERLAAAPAWLRWALCYAALALLLLLGRWQAREFIYMSF
jgi:D-alanyl-lipoteichoic acid acyltransferase DltB (MBOAT superfamily)